ncbi:hypothetical protein SAMN04487949_2418 [Halogranum gelatinilyticum]|uniref:DUF7409 domain-containing protein n=1 Tax=Halogranum gelatinilyticum TaxID=660521 RepID=A0A1G9VKR0_9EURY|nr:hypothetical protein [Halogranum gelatinilyticum]SDM72802.1 hypothetical protein SAMN04487949_2418 [Halogranum gelatinilyticum]
MTGSRDVTSESDASTDVSESAETSKSTDTSDTSESTDTSESADVSELTAVAFVGRKTARLLVDDGIDASDIDDKRVSYTDLVDAGVNPGVAARIRRAHSLSWSFTSDGADLERRSAQVRGLGDAERAWVAASSGDWEASERAAGNHPGDDADTPELGSVWEVLSRPTALSTLPDIDADLVARFHEGGIRSVRRLATVDAVTVADALALDEETVRRWRATARRHRD